MAKWWQKADIVEYQSRGECFERQYDKFGVDGSLTAGENIADNVGLQISYEALENSRGSRFHVVVPHLEQYTKEQLYFISFAQVSSIKLHNYFSCRKIKRFLIFT